MPHQTKPMSVRCRAPRQMDLFAGEPQKTIGDTPAWSGLPDGDTSGTDRPDDTVDPGACRQQPEWRGGRS